ncbi:MAG: hypothetical protein JST30_04515 [Armatimonadetes bacterium]|nr:hypothetical protein [Armatimonadota bacterium]
MKPLSEVLLEPSVRWALQSVLAVTLTCAIALVVGRMARRSAVLKVWVYATALAVCLAAPLVSGGFLGSGRALIPLPVLGQRQQVAKESRVEPASATVTVPTGTLVVEEDVPESVPLSSTEGPVPADLPRSQPVFDLAGAAAALYVGGLALALAKLGAGAAAVRRVVSTARPYSENEATASARLALPKSRMFHRTLVSDTLTVPVVAGALRPVLVLPEGFGEGLSAEQCRQIVAHEAEHARSWHLSTGLLARTVSAVHWFNPLVGLVRKELNRAMEEQCDNASLAHGSREEFAKLLVNLAQGGRANAAPALALSVLDPRFPLEQRIRGLLDPERRTHTTMKPTTRLVVLGASIGGCLLLAGTQLVAAQTQERPAEGQVFEIVQDAPAAGGRVFEVVQDAPAAPMVVTDRQGKRYVLRPAAGQRKNAKRAGNQRTRYVLVPLGETAPEPGRPVMTGPARQVAGRPAMVVESTGAKTIAPLAAEGRPATIGSTVELDPIGRPTMIVEAPAVAGQAAAPTRYRQIRDPKGGKVSAGRATTVSDAMFAPSGSFQFVRPKEGTAVFAPSSSFQTARPARGSTAFAPKVATTGRQAGTVFASPASAPKFRFVTTRDAFAPVRDNAPKQDPFGDQDREYFQRASEMLDGARRKSDPLAAPREDGVKRAVEYRLSTGLQVRPDDARRLAKLELDRAGLARQAGLVRQDALRSTEAKRLAELELGRSRNAIATAQDARRSAELELAKSRTAGKAGQDALRRAELRLAETRVAQERLAETRIAGAARLAEARIAIERAAAAKAVERDARLKIKSADGRKPYRVIEGATVIIYDDGTTEIRPPVKSKTAKTVKAAKAAAPKAIKPATKPSTTTKIKR